MIAMAATMGKRGGGVKRCGRAQSLPAPPSAIIAAPGALEMPTLNDHPATLGVILAGGRARRLGGGDKGLLRIGGETILARVAARFAPQCDGLILSANGDPQRFASLGLPVVADNIDGFAGPLAGVLAALDWTAAHSPATAFVVSAAGDCPFLPRDLVARLHAALSEKGAELAVAASGGRSHPVIGLWRVGLREALRRALVVEGCRKVDAWTARYARATADWPVAARDPFFNVNTADDLAEAARIAARDGD
jgi:molybdopterin-guanine dinucleotide biosynthesis protein A